MTSQPGSWSRSRKMLYVGQMIAAGTTTAFAVT